MRALLILLALAISAPAPAAAGERMEVDVELALMVDVSRSMSPADLEIQRRGYASALLSAPVLTAVRAGLLGRVAIAYVEWAGTRDQRVVVDWTLIEDEDDARAFVEVLTRSRPMGLRRTSIAGALDFAVASMEANRFDGLRRVIDVSGDGPNNQGDGVLAARDRALAAGVVINGLPLMTRDAAGLPWHLEDLDLYYVECVIGGPGAFAIPVHDWEAFGGAVRRKLVLELVGPPAPGPIRARARGAVPGGYDCRIGEKMWERNRRYWEVP